MGKGSHSRNLLKSPVGGGCAAAGANVKPATGAAKCTVTVTGNEVRYSGINLGDLETDSLCFTVGHKSIQVTIDRNIVKGYAAPDATPFRLLFDATVNRA